MQTHTLEEMYGQLDVQKKNIKINDKNSIKNKDRPLLNLKKQFEFMCFFKFNNSLSFLSARKQIQYKKLKNEQQIKKGK